MDLIEQRLETLSRQIGATENTDDADQHATPIVTALREQQMRRAEQEQLASTTRMQTQVEQLTAALELLRAECVRYDLELARLHEQRQTAQETARLEIIQALLPTLDGIDEALRTEQLSSAQLAAAPPTTPFERMRAHTAALHSDAAPAPKTQAAWRARMDLIRQRLLDVLATTGIQPMYTQGQPFDPQRHMALKVVAATDQHPPGTIIAELRRGYLTGNRVLRPAEVVISNTSGEPPMTQAEPGHE
jgi:molecular chaperone GrpE